MFRILILSIVFLVNLSADITVKREPSSMNIWEMIAMEFLLFTIIGFIIFKIVKRYKIVKKQ